MHHGQVFFDLNLFSNELHQEEAIDEARDGVIPHCYPHKDYGLRYVPATESESAIRPLDHLC